MSGVVRLENRVQEYHWGSTTAIAALKGEPPSGARQAELWIGTHPRAPSSVLTPDGPELLDRYLATDPSRIGRRVQERFHGLPFLLKYLAAEKPLSIQCHPNAAQASAGFEREESLGIPRDAEERSYRDPNPKPELIVARGTFVALEGFRPIDEMQGLLTALDLAALRPMQDILTARPTPEGLTQAYRHLMTLPQLDKVDLAHAAAEAAARLAAHDAPFAWVRRLADEYPNDVGILSPLLLNLVTLQKDDALYLDAGKLHAYLEGEGIEIMANSDNVVRGGLTSKPVDVGELLALLSFESDRPQVLRPQQTAPGVLTYPTPAVHFSLSLLRPSRGAPIAARSDHSPDILLGLEGELEVTVADEAPTTLRPGQAVLVTAETRKYTVSGQGEAARASVP